MAPRPPMAEPDLVEHTGFILAEDEMMKTYLSDITVPSRPGTNKLDKVGVWFRFPEGERQIKYPFITIDLLSAEPAFDLFTSDYRMNPVGLYRPSVAPSYPEPPDGWNKQNYTVRNYWPFRLLYQVMVHARSSLHDRYLWSRFMTDVFPPRPFWIGCDVDNTWRRTELVDFASADMPETTESGTKRIFRKVYTVQTLAEVPQERVIEAYRVLQVLIPVVAREQFEIYYRDVLYGHADPLNEFSQKEREEKGEYFHIWHEGVQAPSATDPPPVLPHAYGIGPYGVGPYGGNEP
jgi:hypothetical protein